VEISGGTVITCSSESCISRQWFSEHVPMATDMHATTEELLEMVFPAQSMQRGCIMRTTA
jgi:hypothetical protein